MKKYLELKEELKKIIDEHEPYAMLPSISQTVQKYNVSDITVRRAYGELEREGLVFIHHGKGTFVAPKVKEFKEVCCLYRDLEFMEFIPQKHFDLTILYQLNLKLKEENIEFNLSIYNFNEEIERFVLSRMPSKNLYGVVLFYSGYTKSIPYYSRVNDVISNTVFVDRYIDNLYCNYVGSENYICAKDMAKEALKEDYDRIYVFCHEYFIISASVERIKGFTDAINEMGLSDKCVYFSHENVEYEDFLDNINKVIKKDIKQNKIKKAAIFGVNAYIVALYKELPLLQELKSCKIVCFEEPYLPLYDNTTCIWAEQNFDEITNATVDILKKNAKEKTRVMIPCMKHYL